MTTRYAAHSLRRLVEARYASGSATAQLHHVQGHDLRYRSRRPPETELRERLRSLVAERRRFGYRRLFVLLRRAGEPSGKNRIYRLYREEGLTVR